MANSDVNIPKTAHQSGLKKWHQPSLQRLPIAATANAGNKQFHNGNEGGGGGKGDSNTIS